MFNSVQFFIREISYLIVITLKTLYLFNKIMLCIHIKNFLQPTDKNFFVQIFMRGIRTQDIFLSNHTGPLQM